MKDPTELGQKSSKHEKKSGKSETNDSNKFKHNNVIIVGDSILNNTDEKLLTTKNRYVKVYALSGATTTEVTTGLIRTEWRRKLRGSIRNWGRFVNVIIFLS